MGLDVLRAKGEHHHKQGGYLLKGMLDVLDELKDVRTDTLKEEINRVFHQIHLCSPRVFQSPSDESIQMCELFYPYRKLMSLFHNRFKRLFNDKKLALLKAHIASSSSSFLQMITKLRGNKRGLKIKNKGANNN